MHKNMMPNAYAPSLSEVSVSKLCELNIQTVLLDMDNTLAFWKTTDVPQENVAWLARAKAAGLRLCIVSNGKKGRVDALAEKLNIECVKNARKPSKHRMEEILKELGAVPKETALIGDQLFTDVLVSARCGLYAVLVEALDLKREWWATKLFNRSRERFVRKKVLKTLQNAQK